jgi:hypothetical protein
MKMKQKTFHPVWIKWEGGGRDRGNVEVEKRGLVE